MQVLAIIRGQTTPTKQTLHYLCKILELRNDRLLLEPKEFESNSVLTPNTRPLPFTH